MRYDVIPWLAHPFSRHSRISAGCSSNPEGRHEQLNARELGGSRRDRRRQSIAILLDHAADVVPFRRLDADLAEYALRLSPSETKHRRLLFCVAYGIGVPRASSSGCTARPSRRAISSSALDRSSAHCRSPHGTGSIRLSTTAACRQSRSTSAREIRRSNWGETTMTSMSLMGVAVPCAHDPNRIATRESMPCAWRARR